MCTSKTVCPCMILISVIVSMVVCLHSFVCEKVCECVHACGLGCCVCKQEDYMGAESLL